MKKISILFVLLMVAVACTQGLQTDIDELQSRVADLEERVEKLETNISSLTALVDAAVAGDMITACTPITSGSRITGYTISFSKGQSITIYNGSEISVKKDTDGEYYWAIGDQFVLVEGKKVPVSQVPELKIEDGKWMVSYDGGATWQSMGSAPAGDLITEIKENAIMYEFVLANGTSISVPKEGCGVDFSSVNLYVIPGQTYTYALETSIKWICKQIDGKYRYSTCGFDAEIIDGEGVSFKIGGNDHDPETDYYKVNMKLEVPETLAHSFTVRIRSFRSIEGYECESFGEKDLHFYLASAEPSYDKYIYAASGAGTVECHYSANFESASLSVPNRYLGWISLPETKAFEMNKSISLSANTEAKGRVGYVNIVDPATGGVLSRVYIIQSGTDPNISFVDSEVESILLEYLDGNSDGKISYEEAVLRNNLWTDDSSSTTVFCGSGIVSFPEIVYFPEILMRVGAFMGCSKLESITFPDFVPYETIPRKCFYGCSSLTSVVLPDGIVEIGDSAFEGCGLETVTFPKTLQTIGDSAFKDCGQLARFVDADHSDGSQVIIDVIGDDAFANCSKLSLCAASAKTRIGKAAFMNTGDLNASEDGYVILARKVDDIAFAGSEISTVKLGTNMILGGVKQYPVEELGDHVFRGCSKLSTVYCWFEPPTMGEVSWTRKIDTLYYNLGWERYVALGYDQHFENCLTSPILDIN